MSVTRTNRDTSLLNDNTRKKLSMVMKELSGKIFITEAWRSQERQNYLYAQGRTRPGRIVTWTRNSMHTQGKAVDIAFHGSKLYPPRSDKRRVEVANVFKKYGFDRGGDRKSKDYPHFQDNGVDYRKYEKSVGFYEKLYNENYATRPVEKRIFKYPENYTKQVEGLSEKEKDTELAHLVAFLFEKMSDMFTKS